MFMRQNSGKIVTSIHFLSYTATKHTKHKLKTRILNIIKDKTRMNHKHENYIKKVNYTLFQPCLFFDRLSINSPGYIQNCNVFFALR